MTDETQTKSVTKTVKSVSVITLVPVYPAAGKAPYPIGTKLSVPPERASFWTSRGIARQENAAQGEVNRVGTSADNSVESAPLPAAPPMTPMPKQPGS